MAVEKGTVHQKDHKQEIYISIKTSGKTQTTKPHQSRREFRAADVSITVIFQEH